MIPNALRNSLDPSTPPDSKPLATRRVDVQRCLLEAMADTDPPTKLLLVAKAWDVTEGYASRMLNGIDPINGKRLNAIAEQLPDLFDAFLARMQDACGDRRRRIALLLAQLTLEVAALPDLTFRARKMAKAKL